MTPGYYKRPDANAELFHDGWLRTGDLAYLLDGEMVMCGRIKDMIIVGGRNVFPEDVERRAGDGRGRRAGNVIAFGIDGTAGQGRARRGGREQGDDHAEVRRSVAQRVRDAIGLPRQGDRAGGARQPPQDQLRQAPALALQAPLPRQGAVRAVWLGQPAVRPGQWSVSQVGPAAARQLDRFQLLHDRAPAVGIAAVGA